MNESRRERATADTAAWLREAVRSTRREFGLLNLQAMVLLGQKHADVLALQPTLTSLRKLDIALNGADAVEEADVADMRALQTKREWMERP